MNLFVLTAFCGIAMFNPLWGVAILLVAENSLFHIGTRFAAVALPVGYASMMDVFFFSLYIGAVHRYLKETKQTLFVSRPIQLQSRTSGEAGEKKTRTLYRFAKKTMTYILVPYLVWMVLCLILGVVDGHPDVELVQQIRAAGIRLFPWSLVMVVWMMRSRVEIILNIALGVATLTALVHVIIQIIDNRTVLMAAYYFLRDSQDAWILVRQALTEKAELVRGIPQGIVLMVSTLVFVFTRFISGQSKMPKLDLALAGIQVVAIAITITRSLVATFILGIFMGVVFGLRRRARSRTLFQRTIVSIIGGVVFLAAFFASNTIYLETWLARFAELGQDAAIYSAETNRGLDNVSSWNAIMDKPIFGWGYHVYPSGFAIGPMLGNDIHPILENGLFGGLVAIAISLYMFMVLMRRFNEAGRRDPEVAIRLLPYLAVFSSYLILNSIGAGGSLTGKGLIAMALFIGISLAQMSRLELKVTGTRKSVAAPMPKHRFQWKKVVSGARSANGFVHPVARSHG
ncbi:MAG: hypothetical protein HQL81_11545 [Magnetococcales bacterium]|nr:hypothetical protein [Magnetococcales bacterium]